MHKIHIWGPCGRTLGETIVGLACKARKSRILIVRIVPISLDVVHADLEAASMICIE